MAFTESKPGDRPPRAGGGWQRCPRTRHKVGSARPRPRYHPTGSTRLWTSVPTGSRRWASLLRHRDMRFRAQACDGTRSSNTLMPISLLTPALVTPASPIVLTIGGSDSGGDGGIQADPATFTALGVHGASPGIAATVQDNRRALSPRHAAGSR